MYPPSLCSSTILHPEAFFNIFLTVSKSYSFSNSIFIDSEWEVFTGTRTQVAVRPSSSPGPGATQAQAVSSQLPYERSGGQTIMMMTHPSTRSGPAIVGGSRGGTPVMMGSGDVVNSYYKAQLLGFLYKQG